ncbi:MAG: SDR family oxidoreductase [Bacteroidetes bacterium]|nr:MAG: SDR family oxidoreductase [Bacteroidota bacterium]
MAKQSISILGAGWLGEPLAHQLLRAGYEVRVSTTREEKAARLSTEGLTTYVLHVTHRGLQGDARDFLSSDILILTLPPGGRRDPAAAQQYPYKVRHILAQALAQRMKYILFTSSTGVYGDTEGWVMEDHSLQPNTASGKALVEAEYDIRTAFGERATILRLAGLFGPDRHPGRWFAGRKNLANGEQFVNMVHLSDVIGVIQAVITQGAWGHTLNVCADDHPTRRDFYQAAAYDLGLAEPTFAPDPLGEHGKLVDNRLGKKILGYTYQYSHPMKGF